MFLNRIARRKGIVMIFIFQNSERERERAGPLSFFAYALLFPLLWGMQ